MRANFNRWWLLPFGVLTTSALIALNIVFFEPSFVNRAFAGVVQQGAVADCSGALSSDYSCQQQRYQDLVRGPGVEILVTLLLARVVARKSTGTIRNRPLAVPLRRTRG